LSQRNGSTRRDLAAILVLALALLAGYGSLIRHGPALADEFIYLSGARHFSLTGSLDARYYDTHAILRQGHPHQDNHSPGYVLILGLLMKVVRGGYWTAIALNVAGYLAGALLVHALARQLGRTPAQARLAAVLFLLLPGLLPYVFWAMAEVVLVTLFLAALVCAARLGHGLAGGVLSGLLFGSAFLVRESALFGGLAVLSLLRGRRAVSGFLGASLAFGLLVYAPLSARRSEGASNFWSPTSGTALGFQVVQAGQRGELLTLAKLGAARVAMNLGELFAAATTHTERGILAAFAMLPLWALSRWRELGERERRFLLALSLGWLGIVAVMLCVYVVARWAGFRYLLFLAPPFLPYAVLPRRDNGLGRWIFPALLAGLSLTVNAGVFSILNPFKISRQRRQEGITRYVEEHLGPVRVSRIALQNGWLFGLKYYPVEVISSVPETGGELRVLEQKVWFDYLVLPGDSPLGAEVDGRLRYRRLNLAEPEAPLLVYRRLK
jgi:hypothetical protein